MDKKKLFQEQSALINKINRTLSNKVYTNFVPNYKTIASVYSIFQEALPVKDRVLLEENIVEQMSASMETEPQSQQPIDSLVYSSFVKRFNEEYANTLSENQKTLLTKYISSFSDNNLELKVYMNEEIGRIKNFLVSFSNSEKTSENKNIKEKVSKIYDIIDGAKNKAIDTEMLEMVLNAQQLIEEISENDDKS